MLHSFLTTNRAQLVERCRVTAVARRLRNHNGSEVTLGIPVFLDQLIETLTIEETDGTHRSLPRSGAPGERLSLAMAVAATQHGRELSKNGSTLEQVVRDYGDVCQAITNLAVEFRVPISVEEFRTLNFCVDHAIAGAVTEYALQQAARTADGGLNALDSRLGPLAHELRNHLQVAMHAVKAIKAGHGGNSGSTGAVLDRSLIGMRNLIDDSLAEVRVTAGLSPRAEAIRLADFLAGIEAAASLDPRAKLVDLTFLPVDPEIVVFCDAEMLASAVGNLLQNAFKFTKRHTAVVLNAVSERGRVLIEIRDHCGGLPPGGLESLMKPFSQKGDDRSGLGLGLDICRRSIEANHGTVRVLDLPGTGCIFTIDLPRHATATLPRS